ncbi:VWA domain-containing protein [Acinetobacter sp. YWS30-1]|uniref:vWA domain-containing protein n=1 Tax=Acinetobacter sp. YWS30-1 TaxID=2996862 RepID=UPI002B259FAA|nr:vWA domain-containing protein [Acinetobacter sp. YWS30-1]WPC35428.1 VWA domain-containing protein [Acinetobacter sp. YWS30-1]
MKIKYLVVALSMAGALTTTISLQAFKPTETAHGHKKITLGILDENYHYAGFSIDKFSTQLNDGKTVSFTPEAAEHVYQGNRSTDQAWASFKVKGEKIDLEGELTNPVAHCDDELIDECRSRIEALKIKVIYLLSEYIKTENPQSLGHARGNLGKALHTIQDFYAHSNFADLNTHVTTYQPLTKTSPISAWAKDITVCQSRSWSVSKPIGGFSTNGGNFKLIEKGLDKTKYTTGYFTKRSFLGTSTASDIGGVKCDHGVEMSGLWLSGISKDVPYAPLDDVETLKDRTTPTEIHSRASNQAAQHTKVFLSQLISDIKRFGTAEDQDKMIKALLGIEDEPLYGFIIDDTGSMSDIINGVKNQIQNLIDRVLNEAGSDDSSILTRQFLMVSFNDPHVGEVKIADAETIKNAVANLYAHAGGDCPEKANTGILKAVQAAPSQSKLFVFTDASSNDRHLAGQISAIAKEKNITINYAVSGSCSPIDPSYYEVAHASGGQVILVDHTSEAVSAAFTSIAIDNMATNTQPALISTGQLKEERIFEVNVEPNAKRLSILTNLSNGDIRFIAPNGVEISPSTDIQVNEFIGGKGLKVTNPSPGKWRIRLSPDSTADYSIRSDISSETYIKAVRFLDPTPTGKFGHEGYQNYGNEPVVGQNRIELVLSQGMIEASAFLLDREGAVLKEVQLSRENDTNFSGVTDVTAETARVVIKAKNASNQLFERIYAIQISPRSFLLELANASELMPNATGQLRFKLKNFDLKDTYTITTQSDAANVQAISNQEVTLDRNTEAQISIDVTTGEAQLNAQHLILVTATNSKGEQQTFNYVFELDKDTDNDGISDRIEQGGYGLNPDFDGNDDGIADWQQANVVSMFSRQKRGYLTYAAPQDVQFSQTSSISLDHTESDDYDYDLSKFSLTGNVKMGAKLNLYLHNNVIAKDYFSFNQALSSSQAIPFSKHTNHFTLELKNNDDYDLAPEADKITHIGGVKSIQFSIYREQESEAKKKTKSGSMSLFFIGGIVSLLLLRRKLK